MHGDVGVTRKIDNEIENIHTVMKHPHIKTSGHYYCRCKIQHNMLVHGLLDHGRQHFFHRRRWRLKLNM